MNPSSDFEIVRPKLDHLLSATGMSLKIAWKLTVSVLALAIVLGMLAGPTVQSESPSQKASDPVRVEGKEDCFRVITQLPTEGDTLKIELADTPNKLQMHLIYDKNGINHFFTVNHKLINIGYFKNKKTKRL